MRIVAGDIGGTHARFAIAELEPGARPRLGAMHKYRTREHSDFPSAWEAFRRDCGGTLPEAASLAVAIAIEGEVLRFPNNDWALDRRRLAGELGLERLLLLNDFGAVAHAVSALGPEALETLGGPGAEPDSEGMTTVIGPGTGLGVAAFLRRDGHVEVIETEAAHMGFAPQSLEEEAVERVVRARYGRCSIERVVSGPGLV
jgi:glucokinase